MLPYVHPGWVPYFENGGAGCAFYKIKYGMATPPPPVNFVLAGSSARLVFLVAGLLGCHVLWW